MNRAGISFEIASTPLAFRLSGSALSLAREGTQIGKGAPRSSCPFPKDGEAARARSLILTPVDVRVFALATFDAVGSE